MVYFIDYKLPIFLFKELFSCFFYKDNKTFFKKEIINKLFFKNFYFYTFYSVPHIFYKYVVHNIYVRDMNLSMDDDEHIFYVPFHNYLKLK